jgi:hypothetical protein
LTSFIKKADPRSLFELEKSLLKKDLIATIPNTPKKLKSNALYLAAQAAFNKLKEEDPSFNRFLVSLKGSSYFSLIDLKGREVRMHESEVGSLTITRTSGGRRETKTEPVDKIEVSMVKAMQLYIGNKYNMNRKVKGDINPLYGKSGILGKKRVVKTDGKPNRQLFHELNIYLWRIQPTNRFKAPGSWMKKIAQKKPIPRSL